MGAYFQNFKLDIELLTDETITNFCYLFSSCEQQVRRPCLVLHDREREHAFDTYQLMITIKRPKVPVDLLL